MIGHMKRAARILMVAYNCVRKDLRAWAEHYPVTLNNQVPRAMHIRAPSCLQDDIKYTCIERGAELRSPIVTHAFAIAFACAIGIKAVEGIRIRAYYQALA